MVLDPTRERGSRGAGRRGVPDSGSDLALSSDEGESDGVSAVSRKNKKKRNGRRHNKKDGRKATKRGSSGKKKGKKSARSSSRRRLGRRGRSLSSSSNSSKRSSASSSSSSSSGSDSEDGYSTGEKKDAHNFRVLSLKRRVAEGLIEPRQCLAEFTAIAESYDDLGMHKRARHWRQLRRRVEFGLSLAAGDSSSYRALKTLLVKLVGCREGLSASESRKFLRELSVFKKLEGPTLPVARSGGASWDHGRSTMPSRGFGGRGGGPARPPPPSSEGGPGSRACHVCKKLGHFRRDCPMKNMQRGGLGKKRMPPPSGPSS